MHVEGFGMAVGGFFFPCFKKHAGSEISALDGASVDKTHSESGGQEEETHQQMFDQKSADIDALDESSSESGVSVTEKNTWQT
jgi:hypothetical protein